MADVGDKVCRTSPFIDGGSSRNNRRDDDEVHGESLSLVVQLQQPVSLGKCCVDKNCGNNNNDHISSPIAEAPINIKQRKRKRPNESIDDVDVTDNDCRAAALDENAMARSTEKKVPCTELTTPLTLRETSAVVTDSSNAINSTVTDDVGVTAGFVNSIPRDEQRDDGMQPVSAPPVNASNTVLLPTPFNNSMTSYHYPGLVLHAKGPDGEYDWEALLHLKQNYSSDVALVLLEDRDLVPNSLLTSLGQMQPHLLTESDRVGVYKTRPVGFLGLSCRHCEINQRTGSSNNSSNEMSHLSIVSGAGTGMGGSGGRGLGSRYFPATVRSLSQTTTSQTMIKHISTKCLACPPAIRAAVQEMVKTEQQQSSQQQSRGQRKNFFTRVWNRLHQQQNKHCQNEQLLNGIGT